jgi:hypothetical protein
VTTETLDSQIPNPCRDCRLDGVAVRGQPSSRSLTGSQRLPSGSSYDSYSIAECAVQLSSQLEGCRGLDHMQPASNVAWLIGTSRMCTYYFRGYPVHVVTRSTASRPNPSEAISGNTEAHVDSGETAEDPPNDRTVASARDRHSREPALRGMLEHSLPRSIREFSTTHTVPIS